MFCSEGKTTDEDELVRWPINEARIPNRRELDMFVNTGERIKRFNEHGAADLGSCRPISFTGSSAGVIYDRRIQFLRAAL